MNISIPDLLVHSFVISINADRLENFRLVFSRAGLNTPLPMYYPGFTITNGIHKDAGFIKTVNECNCSFSHLALINYAKGQDWPFICIFEDDALPMVDITSQLEKYLTDIPDNIDVMKLGWLKIKNQLGDFNSKLSCTRTIGSHAYIVFKKYYDRYVWVFNRLSAVADHELINAWHKNARSLILSTNENLFIQHSCNTSDMSVNHSDQFWLDAGVDITKYVRR